MRNLELNLPEQFVPYFTDEDKQIQLELAETPLIQYSSERPNPIEIELSKTDSIYAIDLRGENENEGEAVVLFNPWANAYSSAMHIRAKVLQEYLHGPRVIVFPNNNIGAKYYEFDEIEAASAIVGLAKKASRAIVKLGIEETMFNGASQGASVGAATIVESRDKFNVFGATLVDPPNVIARTSKQLGKDFTKSGYKDLNKAINDSGIPALTKAQRSGGGFNQLIQFANFAKFGLGGMSKENKALREAMAGHDFTVHLNEAKEEGLLPESLVIVRMAASLICAKEIEQQLHFIGLSDKFVKIPNRGHGYGDHLPVNGLVSRIAFTGDSLPVQP